MPVVPCGDTFSSQPCDITYITSDGYGLEPNDDGGQPHVLNSGPMALSGGSDCILLAQITHQFQANVPSTEIPIFSGTLGSNWNLLYRDPYYNFVDQPAADNGNNSFMHQTLWVPVAPGVTSANVQIELEAEFADIGLVHFTEICGVNKFVPFSANNAYVISCDDHNSCQVSDVPRIVSAATAFPEPTTTCAIGLTAQAHAVDPATDSQMPQFDHTSLQESVQGPLNVCNIGLETLENPVGTQITDWEVEVNTLSGGPRKVFTGRVYELNTVADPERCQPVASGGAVYCG